MAASAAAAAPCSNSTPPVNTVEYAGRLHLFKTQWSLITEDRTVLSWIDGYKIPFSSPPTQNYIPSTPAQSTEEKRQFNEAIGDLLRIGAVSLCEPCEGQFISSIFLTPKPNGKYRFILNLKNLNRFIMTDHFKLEDLRTAIKLVTQGCWMTTLDLKDAYLLVKIHENSKKYLRFIYGQKLYQFNVLPFGLNTAPFVFTKITKPIVKLLRTAGLLSTLYLDDWLLLGRTFSDCVQNLDITKKLLVSLGFIINEEKSIFVPSMKCKYLGMIINSHELTLSLPQEKRARISSELQAFQKLRRCSVRKLAQLTGLLVSACPGIEYGLLHTKELERCKFLNLKNDDDYEKIINIPDSLQIDIQWWLNHILNSVRHIRCDDYHTEIFSDASTTGWGAACMGNTASGSWSNTERKKHINYLELLAACIALKIFAKDLSDCQILLRVDNSTAVAYINRMGGVQYPHLTQITREIWDWCEDRGLYIYASYIKSSNNIVADAESRRNHPDIEWELDDRAFNHITRCFGSPVIDLFASRINKKCEAYISWHRDPDAIAIDAFTISWANKHFYAFPPFSIILKVLRKIIAEKSKGIVVVPSWPTQPWYPVFQALTVSKVLSFPPHKRALISHSSSSRIHQSITLEVAVLSGRHYQEEAYHHLHWK